MKNRPAEPADPLERIARDTLRMPDPIAAVMGGPTKDQARVTLRRLKRRRALSQQRTR